MRSLKASAKLAVVTLALGVVMAANASAAQFTYSATGELEGHALTNQVITVSGGQVKCSTAKTNGTISSLDFTQQHVTVNYSGCSAFGFVKAEFSPATYTTTASGVLDITNTITINVPGAGCHLTIAPQERSSLAYDNNGGKLIVTSNVSGIVYESSGGLCGSSGSSGTFVGNDEIERVGGGTVSFDP